MINLPFVLFVFQSDEYHFIRKKECWPLQNLFGNFIEGFALKMVVHELD